MGSNIDPTGDEFHSDRPSQAVSFPEELDKEMALNVVLIAPHMVKLQI